MISDSTHSLTCLVQNRLEGDQITADHATLSSYMAAPFAIVFNYIKKYIQWPMNLLFAWWRLELHGMVWL